MIDRELVTRKLALITGDLNELGALAGKILDEYLYVDKYGSTP